MVYEVINHKQKVCSVVMAVKIHTGNLMWFFSPDQFNKPHRTSVAMNRL